MENTPRARGPGRSGPRRRTGCLTCRARKVRCDEAKPTCANCTRLHLRCSYKNVIIPGMSASPRTSTSTSTSTRTRSSRARSTSSASATQDAEASDLSVLRTEQRADFLPAQLQQHTMPLSSSSADPESEFHIPFDMLGFIGEITSDFQQRHLDLTDGGSIAPSPITAEADGNLFSDERQMTWAPGEFGEMGSFPESESPSAAMGGERVWEEQLLKHFQQSDPPPTIFGPVDLEWRYVREIMVEQSRSSRALLLAICCYSGIHKAWAEGTHWRLGPTYHQQASSEIQSALLGEVSDSVLKRVFASVLLLMLAELCSPDGWRPATPFLHSAYLLIQRFHNRTRSWTGPAHLIVSWVSLLDVKALVAGRDGDPLAELGNLPQPISQPLETPTNDNKDNTEPETYTDFSWEPTNPSYLITNALTSPVFTFFLQTQQVTRRIVCIDLYHRTRGTVSDEYEVLQIAHQVSADLETLWNRRPRILDIYTTTTTTVNPHPDPTDPQQQQQEEGKEKDKDPLHETLTPQLSIPLTRSFRQYVANFLALFVYLHRVAFAIYPRTDRVFRAVDQIIQLAEDEVSLSGCVPVGFVWPLFIAGLEGSIEQRGWIVREMRRMADITASTTTTTRTAMEEGGGVSCRHPNAAQALLLLEEMTRRQDASRTWADSRCVRRELFADFFVMI